MNTELMFSSATGAHDTPLWLVDEIAGFMGGIDLDPCASETDPAHTGAAQWYTKAENGLERPYSGRVYMNPPYGREIGLWTRKMALEYNLGNVSEGILLVPARTDTRWWGTIAHCPVCFVRGRLRFGDADHSAPFPSALIYMGDRVPAFMEWAGQWGTVYAPREMLSFE